MKSHFSISITLLILVAFTYQTILESDLPVRGRNAGVPQLNLNLASNSFLASLLSFSPVSNFTIVYPSLISSSKCGFHGSGFIG